MTDNWSNSVEDAARAERERGILDGDGDLPSPMDLEYEGPGWHGTWDDILRSCERIKETERGKDQEEGQGPR